MKKCIFILFILFTASIYSQSPDWSVNASSYQYNMTFTVFLNVDGVTLTNANDKIGAFVNGENRGEATVVYNPNAKKYVAYLSVLANTVGETINFKIYDSTNNATLNVVKTEVFEINKNIGGAFQSYSVASPALSSQASILGFSFQGISTESNSITNNTVNIEVLSTVDISNLTPIFTAENNSKVYLNKVLQVSGNNTLDFTNEVVYEVLSEDESQNVSYTVKVKKLVNTHDFTFSDATYVYNGTEKSLVISGTLPSGTTVTYSNNGLTNVGTKQVTATISGASFQDVVLTANLTVSPATITGVTFSDENFNYDGSEKTILIDGAIPNGTSLNYVLNSRTEAGAQEVFALITGDNYVNLTLKANLIIVKTSFTDNFTLIDKSFVFDGNAKSILITESLPTGTTVSYANNAKTAVGVHEVVATISKANYQDLVLTANLTITKATLTGITFVDKSFVFDGTEKSIAITGSLPTGTSVSYANNAKTEAGVSEVTATISKANYQDLVLKANLTITKATFSGITFNSKSFEYDGTQKSFEITGSLPANTSVSYANNTNTDTGVYEVIATISGANYQDLVLTANLTITKATLTGFTFVDKSFVYDGTPKSLTINGSLPTGTSVSYTNNNLIDVGVYEVVATISGANFNELVLKANLTITKTVLSNFALTSKDFEYDGTEKVLAITGSLPTGTSVSYVNNAKTTVGAYQVTATISGVNYQDLVLIANLTITKATLTDFTFADKSFVFDGTEKSIAITESLPPGTTVSYVNNGKTEAGVSEVTATISKSNYNDLVLKANLTITKATFSGITFNSKSFEYDGTQKAIEITGSLPVYTAVSYANNTKTEVGIHEVVATISKANYNDLVLTANLIITKATLTGFTFVDKSFVYDGTPKSLTINGSLPTGTSVSYTNNNLIDVGVYEVVATISGANFNELVLKASLTITKTVLSNFALTSKSFEYDGTEKSLTISGNLPTGTSVSYVNNTKTTVGAYEVTATISGINYQDLVLTANLTITNATLTGFAFVDKSFEYDGTEKSLSVLGNLPIGTSVSYANNNLTNIGVSEVTATISKPNYNDLVLTANLTITNAAFSEITFNSKSFEYDGTQNSIEVEGNLPTGTSVSYTNNKKIETGIYEVTATISVANYLDLVLTANLTITKATFSGYTFDSKSFVYDGLGKSLTIIECLPAGTSVSYTNNYLIDVGVYEVTASISGSNYEELVLKANLTITKTVLSNLAFTSKSFEYDGTSKSLSIIGSLPTGTSVSYVNNAKTAVGTYNVTATISGANYQDLVLTANLTVTNATLTGFTFVDKSFVFDGTEKSIAITGNLPTGTSVSYANNAKTEAGVHEVTATLTRANYQDLVLKANLIISKADQVIHFNPISIPLGKTEFTLEASSTSGLEIVYTSSNTAVATISGNLISLLGSGATTITASQSGNANYNAAESKSQVLNFGTLGKADNLIGKEEIILYPNPVKSKLKLKINSDENLLLLIFDAAGKLVKEINNYQSEKNIDVSGLAAGTYVIKIKGKNGKTSIDRFIKL
ncbi:MBG domain-containing protein [Polaribacter sp. Q13]|uniref:MBG domain-containing protein n=1 Tax=Polaribacter sp. Q13 TaxID=2806551 RepID=UPI00193B99BB|nr:MBG domain-containing protein [Polaribacter sp. Q13]QVY64266.1 T9SS type A sorting domain-containing protein [Polaribacter sp. Q13]